MRERAILALEDGTVFEGRSFGRTGETCGEVVFNTSLTGYQEVLTDPSYAGQIVTMTCPHIGNYGVNPDDVESVKPQVAGYVVREITERPSSWRAAEGLGRWLDENGIVGISEIDTRALTRHLRTFGAKRGVIGVGATVDAQALVVKARGIRSMVGLDLAREVTCDAPWSFDPLAEKVRDTGFLPTVRACQPAAGRYRVVAYDFGMKRNILRNLAAAGCDVTVVPATTAAADVLALRPDGVFLSNGPGDPEPCTYAIEAARDLLQKLPLFGICLGHQILGLACGARTFKLKFGHRGGNHPVKNLATGQVEITSQNHGFAVDPALFARPEFVLTHVNLNDGTVEGFRLRDRPVISVQFHPESSPGPHDSHYLFEEFVSLMNAHRTGK